MQTDIIPVTVFPDIATILEVPNARILAFGDTGSAMIDWRLLSSDGRLLKTGCYTMTEQEYSAWGSDDNYVLDIVISALGLTTLQVA